MFVPYLLIFGLMLFLGGTAVYGLVWAIQHGQFRDLHQGARSIFDDDEPVGQMTDAFPGQTPPAAPASRPDGDA